MRGISVALLAFLCIWGCGGQGAGSSETPAPDPASGPVLEVRVFAAASLIDVVSDWKEDFERSGPYRVKASFGATSDLARQVLDGAPCDLFIAASADWTARLQKANALQGPSVVVARNRLVCIAPREGVADARSPRDLRKGGFLRLAIADENVPAGQYAREALKHAGVFDHIKDRFVGQKDVRAVLRAVAAAECEAGFVYASDAKADSAVRELFTFALGSHSPIEYPAALCRGGRGLEGARRLLEHILSSAGQDRLRKRGFLAGDAP